MDFLDEFTAPEHLQAFLTSLAIGLLMGLERERRSTSKAGLRTFALVSMLGTLAALLSDRVGSGWILAAGLLLIGVMMVAAYARQPEADDPGTTSVVALLVCYCLGAAVWYGFGTLAIMLGIVATMLLYFRTELHGFTHQLTSRDLISILQFAVLTFIVLPILPDRDYGPYEALNPHQIWLMVVLISGVSLAGYAALRLVGSQHGAAVIGFFGGLASSTATTLVFARHARGGTDVAGTSSVVILLANLMMMLRLSVIAVLLAPALIRPMAVVLGVALLFGGAAAAIRWRRLESEDELPMPAVHNPTEIRTALGFGLLYGLVLFCAAWLSNFAGSKGMYSIALVSGLTDVDAITLSSLRLFSLEKLSAFEAVTAVTLAVAANLAFKGALAVFTGGRELARLTLPGMMLVAVGLLLGWALLFWIGA